MARPFNKTRYDWPCTPECTERQPGCHGRCERYLAKRAERDAQLAEHIAKTQQEAYTYDMVRKNKDAGKVNRGRIIHDM